MTNTNIPRLRFSEFDGEWQSGNIGDKLKVVMGQSPHSENYTSDSNQNILVQGNADILNGKINPRIYTSEITKASKKNEIIMTVRAPVGELALNQFDYVVIGRGVASLTGNSFDYFLLDRIKKMGIWNRFSSGSTFDAVNSNDIKSMSISFPKMNEQERIGSFFSKIDKLLELQTQELEQLKKLKQGYLQKMFPQDGESVPRLRFSGFSGEWREETLSSICRYETSNYTQGQFKESDNVGKYVVFDVSGISGKDSRYDQESEYVSIVKDGSGVGTVSFRPSKTSVINTMNYILSDNEDIKFIYYLLQNFDFRRFKIGTGIPHIYFSDYSKTYVKIPEIEEQKQISSFLGNLDSIISVTEDKVDELKQQKKAYLQKMFI